MLNAFTAYCGPKHPAKLALLEAGCFSACIMRLANSETYRGNAAYGMAESPFFEGQSPEEVAEKIAGHFGIQLAGVLRA